MSRRNDPLLDLQKLPSGFKSHRRNQQTSQPITRPVKPTPLPNSTTLKLRNLGGSETVSKPPSTQSHYSKPSAVVPSTRPEISSSSSSSSVPLQDSERSDRRQRSASVDRRAVNMGSMLCGLWTAGVEEDPIPVRDSDLPKVSNSQNASAQVHSSFKAPSSVTSSGGRTSRSSHRSSNSDRIRSASQGLRNLGNTCYMNSILQCLASVPWQQETNFKDDFLNEFLSLMTEMKERGSNDPINPVKFKKQISVLGFRFSTSEQNDAHEFLVCLLGRLKKSLNDAKKRNIVEEKILGKQENLIEFAGCRHSIINIQPFFTVSLPLVTNSCSGKYSNPTVNLTDCIEHYTKREQVEGEALCLECQKMQSVTIETKFKSLPRILILHLKRYELQTMTKLNNQVTFLVNNLTVKENDAPVSYDLFGVCNHFGSLRFGHYTADIKSDSGNWYSYSDSSVSPLYNFPSSSSSSSDAYIFFYKRRDW